VRELHDTVAQTLTLLTFSLDELLAVTQETPAHALAVAARTHATTAIRQARRLMGLGSEPADDCALSRLQRLLKELKHAGVEVRLSGSLAADTLPERVSDCLLHIAHEAVMNVRRHARARTVIISFRRAHDSAWLVVSDDGRGFASPSITDGPLEGHGLLIMRERAMQLGGTVTIRTRSDGGTTVTARIPVLR
jgi:signal transduction histidine kinase